MGMGEVRCKSVAFAGKVVFVIVRRQKATPLRLGIVSTTPTYHFIPLTNKIFFKPFAMANENPFLVNKDLRKIKNN
jgi:hypothetical protein